MTEQLASLALGISASVPLSLLAKATAILLLGLLLVRRMRTTRASRRSIVLAWTFTLLAVLPVAVAFGPAIPVAVRETRLVVPTSPAGVTVTTAALPAAISKGQPWNVQQARAKRDGTVAVMVGVWAIGAAISFLPVFMTLSRLSTLRRTAREWTLDGSHSAHRVTVLAHEELAAPMTFGWLRPFVVLPRDADSWREADFQRALAHELEHVRRGDWLVHLLARGVCALYWFHPLVWRAWRQLRLEADRACDDAAIDGSDAREFAEQLVTLAERIGARIPAPALSIAGGDLATRVNALLNPKQARGRSGLAYFSTAAVAAVTLGASVAAVEAVSVTTIERASDPRTTIEHAPAAPARAVAPQPAPAAPVQQTNNSASPARTAPPETQPAVPAQNPVAAVTPPSYVIGIGDVLIVSFWPERDLSADVVVRPDGKITLPPINEIDAAGLTPNQLRDRLTKLAEKFLEGTTITVGVRRINSRRVYIVGGVQKPGQYDLLAPMSVVQLISVAGGLRALVDGRNIVIIREERGTQIRFEFNYREVQSGVSLGQNIQLAPGDTVLVPE